MSYITSGQAHQIRMMYGGNPNHDSFQEMLQTFGQLVENKVLPAEKKTEMERAQDSLKSLAFQLSQSGKYDQQALETAIAQTKKNEKIPDAVYRQIADFGLPGMAFSEQLGGLEIPYPVFMACLETLGKASPSVGVRYAISNTVAEGLRFNYEAGQLSGYGESILRELIAGEKLGGFALTEGSAAGSNILKEMITRAVPLQNGNGYRKYACGRPRCRVFYCFCGSDRTDAGELRASEIRCNDEVRRDPPYDGRDVSGSHRVGLLC